MPKFTAPQHAKLSTNQPAAALPARYCISKAQPLKLAFVFWHWIFGHLTLPFPDTFFLGNDENFKPPTVICQPGKAEYNYCIKVHRWCDGNNVTDAIIKYRLNTMLTTECISWKKESKVIKSLIEVSIAKSVQHQGWTHTNWAQI